MSSRSVAGRLLLSLVVTASAVVFAAQPVAADDIVNTGTSVYRLDSAKGVIRVSADIVVKNNTPNTVEYVPCMEYSWDPYWGLTPYSSTCPKTTRYYVNTASTWVERNAKNVKVTSGGRSVRVKNGDKGESIRRLDLTFGKIWKGQSRKLHLTYTIPGGKPRSANTTRAMRAYASFCVMSHAIDRGKVEVRVPKGFDVSVVGARLTDKVKGSQRIFSSGQIGDPMSWYACLSGTNDGGYESTPMTTASGRSVLLKAWPEDDEWASEVGADVANGLTSLAALVGSDMAGDEPLVIQESVTGGEYAGSYSETTNTITVDENFRQEALVEHELAHVWFNGSLFEDRWLAEGNAEWAARAVAGADACRQPVGTSDAGLADWQFISPRATDAERWASPTSTTPRAGSSRRSRRRPGPRG